MEDKIKELEKQIKDITKLIKNEKDAINEERDKRYKKIDSLEKKQANIRDEIIRLKNKTRKMFWMSISFANKLENDRTECETLNECMEYLKKQINLKVKNGGRAEYIQIYINPFRKLKL